MCGAEPRWGGKGARRGGCGRGPRSAPVSGRREAAPRTTMTDPARRHLRRSSTSGSFPAPFLPSPYLFIYLPCLSDGAWAAAAGRIFLSRPPRQRSPVALGGAVPQPGRGGKGRTEGGDGPRHPAGAGTSDPPAASQPSALPSPAARRLSRLPWNTALGNPAIPV